MVHDGLQTPSRDIKEHKLCLVKLIILSIIFLFKK